MSLANTAVPVVERATQNGCCQCLYPHGESYLPPALCESVYDQQVGLTQAFFKLLLMPWVLEFVGFCLSPLRVKSLFPTVLQLS